MRTLTSDHTCICRRLKRFIQSEYKTAIRDPFLLGQQALVLSFVGSAPNQETPPRPFPLTGRESFPLLTGGPERCRLGIRDRDHEMLHLAKGPAVQRWGHARWPSTFAAVASRAMTWLKPVWQKKGGRKVALRGEDRREGQIPDDAGIRFRVVIVMTGQHSPERSPSLV